MFFLRYLPSVSLSLSVCSVLVCGNFNLKVTDSLEFTLNHRQGVEHPYHPKDLSAPNTTQLPGPIAAVEEYFRPIFIAIQNVAS